jgi:hypothetical protein
VSDILINTITTVVSTAIVAAIAKLIERYGEDRPRLRATPTVYDIAIPTLLQIYLNLMRDTQSMEPDMREKLEILSNLRSYMQLTLRNHGKEKTEALTLTITDRMHKYLFQIDEQSELLRPNEGKLSIGYLPPKESRLLQIWSTNPGTWGYIGVVKPP